MILSWKISLKDKRNFYILTFDSGHTNVLQDELLKGIDQGCQTHFHPGLHQPRGCLQRAECNFRTV